MTETLRQRRRNQTSRDIRIAALELCFTEGFDKVTTEAISTRAGVSPRTFFNYFLNKESAIISHPPDFPAEAVEAFVNGKGRLLDDLRILMRAQFELLQDDRKMIDMVHSVIRTSEVLRATHEAAMRQLQSKFTDIIQRRLHDVPRQQIETLCSLILITVGQVMTDSKNADDTRDIATYVDEALDTLEHTLKLIP
nr:TetR family transcriptional regulator [Amylibacter sp.]